MKLAMLVRYFPPESLGGGEKYMEEIWKRAKEKYEVELVSGWKNDPKLLPDNTKSIKLNSKNRYFNYLKFYRHSKKILNEIKPDLIHCSCYEIPIIEKPTIITVCHLGHLIGHVKSNPLKHLQRRLSKNRFNKSTKLVAISHSTKSDLEKMGFNGVEVAYPGIDTTLFKPKDHQNDKLTFVCPSRISPEKGHHIIIDALKFFPQETLKKIEVIIVGFVSDHGYLNSIKRKAEGLPIKFETNVDSIVPYYQNSDAILFPTLMYEGFGFTAAEGLACDKVVIASDFPSIREIMGGKGMLIKPGDPNDLARAMARIFYNRSLLDKLGKGGHERIKDNFDWDKCFKIYDRLYQELHAKK